MTDLIDKLKSADFKSLATDHGEKLLSGLLGSLLLFALMTTSWSRYEKTPEELMQKTRRARSTISRRNWTDSDDAKNGLYSAAAGLKEEQVHQLLTSDAELRAKNVARELARRRYSNRMFQSVYPPPKPVSQPELLAPEELVATVVRAIIPKAATGISPEMQNNSDAELPGAGDNKRRLKEEFASAPEAHGDRPEGLPGLGSSGVVNGPGNVRADGIRLVSVRGIVPLVQQIERVASALNLTRREAAVLVDYWDFRLERRSKPIGGKLAWSGWQQVDIRTAEEVLRDAASWDPELIELSLTDPVLTMPLPTRVLYYWMKDEVSHPKLDDYVLPPSKRDRQMEIYGVFIEQKIDEFIHIKSEQKRGFSGLQRGGDRQFGPTTEQFGRKQSQRTQELITRVAQQLDRDNLDKVKQELLERIMRSQTAAGQLLLFRYLDFDVKPGAKYQYRVQLVLANPNFARPQQLVINPEITKHRFLTTPFSQPTVEVTVPNDMKFYVTKIDDANGSSPSSATFDVYQWSTMYGTTINQQLKVPIGAFVGMRTKANVVDPGHGQYVEDQEVDFTSDDVLVDVFDARRPFDLSAHPDLKPQSVGKLRKGLGLSHRALLLNEFGELVSFDPVSMAASHGEIRKRFEDEQDDTKQIRQGGASSVGKTGRSGNQRRGGNILRRRSKTNSNRT